MKILHEKIDAGAIAIAQLIKRHHKSGESISIIQDGKIMTLTAEQIPAIQDQESLTWQHSDNFSLFLPVVLVN